MEQNWKTSILNLAAVGSLAVAPMLSPAAAPAGTSYVVTIAQQVNIRTGPDTDRYVLGRAEKGDLFLYDGEEGGWFRVRLFSGEPRYISKTHSAHLNPSQILPGHNLALPEDAATRRSLMASIAAAREEARQEAEEVIPPEADQESHDRLLDILTDSRLLRVFHIYGVHAALWEELEN